MELYIGVKLDAATPDAAALAGVDEVRQIKDLPSELVHMTSWHNPGSAPVRGG